MDYTAAVAYLIAGNGNISLHHVQPDFYVMGCGMLPTGEQQMEWPLYRIQGGFLCTQ